MRVDGREKVMGAALYTVDIEIPGMIHGKMLRSPVPHAKVVRIDASRAEQLPGVICVFTRDDIKDIDPTYGPAFKDQPVVAMDKVHYVGDIVAGVAAETAAIAEAACQLIEVDYEELPPLFDPLEAVKPEAPLIHETIPWPEHGFTFADLALLHPLQGTNICNHTHLERGSVEEGFKQADVVFEDTFTCPATQHVAMEAHCSLAQWDVNGKLTVWSSTQTPFFIRTVLSQMFHLPATKVRVIVPYLGAGYGSKDYVKLEPLTACLARKSGRPVRMMLTREEVFHTITKHALVYRLKTGVKRDGTIVARKCEEYWDTGAYAVIGARVSKKAGQVSAGPYDMANVCIDSYCVYTNHPPAGAFRGFGVPQVTWAYESQMDIIAERLGLDPLEIRLKNLVGEGTIYYTGDKLHSVGVSECLKRVAAAVGWEPRSAIAASGSFGMDLPAVGAPPRPRVGKVRGKGLACYIKNALTPSVSTAQIKVNEDGSVQVLASTVELGQGSDTIFAQVAAEVVGVSVDKVTVSHPDTDHTPYDMATLASRATFHVGKAVELAGVEARDQLYEVASEMLEASPEDLEAANDHISIKGSPERFVTVSQVVRRRFGMTGGNILGRGVMKTFIGKTTTPEGEEVEVTASHWSVGAGAAEVEVDTETGEVKILKYVIAADAGKALNPLNCEGQLEGSVVCGVGQTFTEAMVYEGGQLLNPNFADYRIPVAQDIPGRLDTILVEVPHRDGPFGAKGLGEMSVSPVSPSVANAISDAIGVRIKDLPITPERVLRALRGEPA